jgi:hypothetical protein
MICFSFLQIHMKLFFAENVATFAFSILVFRLLLLTF